jgi:hypothetical protein
VKFIVNLGFLFHSSFLNGQAATNVRGETRAIDMDVDHIQKEKSN